MAETEFSNKFVTYINAGVGHASRVENVAETGTPDVNYTVERTTGWIETKVAHGAYLYFETFQRPWFKRRTRAGGLVWVLAEISDIAYLFSADTVLAAPGEPHKKWYRIRTEELVGKEVWKSAAPYQWSTVIPILKGLHAN